MTHMPPQFRTSTVLIEEWRQRAAEHRPSNHAAADVYERCADELEDLDVHTEGPPAGAASRRVPRQARVLGLATGLVAGGLFAAALNAARTPRATGE